MHSAKGLISMLSSSSAEHDRDEPLGKAVGHQVLEVLDHAVLADAAELDHQEGDERQAGRDRDVAGRGRHQRAPGPSRLQVRMKKNVLSR